MNEKLPSGTLDRLWADPENWRVHFIYVCKDDPRIIVPKRNKWGGWTLNFAHASAWKALLVSILYTIIPATYIAKSNLSNATWIWFAYLVGIVAFTCGLCWILSSPKRYEKAG